MTKPNDVPPDGVMPQAQVIQFVIEFAPATGSFNVRAPEDPILCYGLLEFARQTIQRRQSGELKPSSILRV